MHMELPIDLLQTFSSIAETGSFTRAGESQHITQSAVSMQMKRLEEIVGHPLFQKSGRSFHLTPAGETLLGHALVILKAHNEAVAVFARPEMFGRIRFGCAEEYAFRFLHTVLADFRKVFPRIRVDLFSADSPDLEQMLIREELDLCLLGIQSEGGRVIHREPLVWATSCQGTGPYGGPGAPGALSRRMHMPRVGPGDFAPGGETLLGRVCLSKYFQHSRGGEGRLGRSAH